MRRGILMAAATAALGAPAQASAAISSVFSGQTISGNAISCTTQSDGVRVCHGTYNNGPAGSDIRLKSFDGQPLEVWVILPPAPSSGTDGGYPLVDQSHGWGGSAGGPNDGQYLGPTADSWAHQGYAVLQLTARGFNASCGSLSSRSAAPTACTNGYIRLDDERYEVRDIQHAAGLLVDAGIVDRNRIGATGESYGGGVSLELATLKNRVMNSDGSLSPWTSPNGTPMHLAAAAPVIPWSDLAYSLMPNGRTLDYVLTGRTDDISPVGVEKQSFQGGLFALGAATGYYSTTDPQADIPGWFAEINAGEPYDTNPQAQFISQQITQFHSAYYLLDGAYGTAKESPTPLLIANGFTDDLFGVDEAVRYYNLDCSLYPSDPVTLVDGDFGHMRAQNKSADRALLSSRINAMFDHYVKGGGPTPPLGVTAFTETCPSTAPSGGPFSASSWSALHPGEVDLDSAATQTILSSAGNPQISGTVDPVTGGGACATASGSDQGPGVASYRLPTVTGNGYTLLGSPTVIANLNVTGQFAFIAARLWDVNTATNTETLVARGIYRINSNNPNGQQVFQLHPGAWHFAAGHVPKLELLGQDSPYARTSNGQFSIAVSGLQLRLPVHDVPGAPGVPQIVSRPRPAVLPGTCAARPFSTVSRRRTRASRHRMFVAGTAGELRCAHASRSARRRAHVVHVFVIIFRPATHGRCRFLLPSGGLSRPRRCTRAARFRARGTSHWKLRLRMHIPRGRYVIMADPVDGLHHHQLPDPASMVSVFVR